MNTASMQYALAFLLIVAIVVLTMTGHDGSAATTMLFSFAGAVVSALVNSASINNAITKAAGARSSVNDATGTTVSE